MPSAKSATIQHIHDSIRQSLLAQHNVELAICRHLLQDLELTQSHERRVVLERENLTEGSTFMAGIWIKGCYNVTDTPNQVDPPKGVVIANNVVRGTKRNIETGWGIILEQASECIVQGNYMADAKTGGILCLGCDKSVFMGNSYPEGVVLKFEDSSTSRIDPDHRDNVVIGNIGDTISIPNTDDRGLNIVMGNRLLGSGTAAISGSGAPSVNAAYVGQDYEMFHRQWHTRVLVLVRGLLVFQGQGGLLQG